VRVGQLLRQAGLSFARRRKGRAHLASGSDAPGSFGESRKLIVGMTV
jgi:hypothetical protein